MSILQAKSYAAVRHLVTDVKVLSTKERNHVLWYACDRGDLRMVKSVIRAGCDVDHFHRGHTPLMMASIRGHNDVVKELILAGCKVDLRSTNCFVSWFRFITKMVSAWPDLVVWAVAMLFLIVLPNLVTSELVIWVNVLGYWLLVPATTLHFISEDSFKLSGMLRMKSWTKYVILAGIVPATVVELRVVGTVVTNQTTPLPVLVNFPVYMILAVLITVTGVGVVIVVSVVADRGATVVAAAVLAAGIWTGGGSDPVIMAGALTVAVALLVADPVASLPVVATIVVWVATWIVTNISLARDVNLELDGLEKTAVCSGILAIALTVAMAVESIMVGAVPFAVAMIVAVVVIMAGMRGLELASTGTLGGPALPAILLLASTPIGAIIRMCAVYTTGMTALHYAAWYDHITCGTHLVEAGANVQAENKKFRTPLHICSHRFKAAVQRAQSSPPKQVIAVIGNSEYGKSTLIAALRSEAVTYYQKFFYLFAQVHNITQRTAGIETVPFSSAEHGKILFYDFAGQSDYHGPHQPFLEAILSKPGVSVIVLLLVKVTEGRAFITQQLIRWLQPIALASTSSTPQVLVVGSFLDQAKSKKEIRQKLHGCIDSVQKEYPFLKVQGPFLLDCRQPEGVGIKRLHGYLQRALPIWSTSSAVLYNVHWVMAQLQKTFSEQSLQLSTFKAWLQDNAQSLPTGLPPPEDLCKDLSAVGYILFLRNKQDLSQSWLVLDLQTILHNVYGTLFSPSQDVVNRFGLLPCTRLSKLFPKLDPKMIQEVLITLEFCIRVDPLLLKEEMLSLTEQEEVEGWLYFPALVSAKAHEVFTPDPQCLQWACWQLKTHDKHIILAHLLQGILLHLAATHVFIEKELPHNVREHCCSVWVNGLSWESTKGVDVAVHIRDSSTVQVIGRSKEGPDELYRYMSGVTQSIFKTIAKLSPALKATPYIIHPYTYIGLDKSTSPPTRYPVASIIGSIEAGHKYVHSLPISSGNGSVNCSRASLQELFGGWSPSHSAVQRLKEAQKDPRE